MSLSSKRISVLGILSLIIVSITATYGGWHLSETLVHVKDPQWFLYARLVATFFFTLVIVLVDYIILVSSGEWYIMAARFFLAIAVAIFIGWLTTLKIFSETVENEISTRIKNEEQKAKEEYKGESKAIRTQISDISKSIDELKRQKRKLNNQLADEMQGIRGGKQIKGAAGDEGIAAGIRKQVEDVGKDIKAEEKRLDTLSDDLKKGVNKAKETAKNSSSSRDILAQTDVLWDLIIGEKKPIIKWTVGLVMSILLFLDLTPLLVKVGMSFDETYKEEVVAWKEVEKAKINAKKEVEEAKIDAEKEVKKAKIAAEKTTEMTRVTTTANQTDLKEKLRAESEKEQIILRDNLRKPTEKKLIKFHEESLSKINSLYATEKYIELIESFEDPRIPEAVIKRDLVALKNEQSRIYNGAENIENNDEVYS